ncbi:glycine betaine ABC transporter substrate-binding protein [Tsukamurella pulmonis]|uniref:Osmoprotectant transport system substrate-binding protein n=1 Tax=Tsukamurella pulmonis TaxID=47312 RepID=A0A1H1AUI5_9ACTN|nr:glycine betaine ABC transporter substrate-binding protein [Tsukamurella pulmonis]SDQ43418.1 osmoprotectant transport system substrate-binding protein [Tsukamurella pulmonis]SUP26075.1 Choline-binding protein precursor [Tsukamurella pulmonis]
MSGRARVRRALLPVLTALSLVLAGCGLESSSGHFVHAEPVDGQRPLAGAKISVTSKSFSEGILLGKISTTILQAAGAEITDLTNAPGSMSSRGAMTSGAADVSWEYTGTIWVSYLKQTETISDSAALWTRVRDAERANGIEVLSPAPFNNTYAFAVTPAQKAQLNLNTLSDLFRLPPAQRSLCVDPEFQSRPDGLGRLLEKYEVPLGGATPANTVTTMDAGVIYSAISGDTCLAGDVYATDGRIRKLGLQLLEDDRKFFLPYDGVPEVRSDALAKYPAIKDVLGKVSALLTNETMQELNGKIDIDGKDPADVAATWLREVGLVR